MFHSTGASGDEKYLHSYLNTWCVLGQNSQQRGFQKDSVAIRCPCSQQSSTFCAFLTKTWHFWVGASEHSTLFKVLPRFCRPILLGLPWADPNVTEGQGEITSLFYKTRIRLLLGLQLKWQICLHDCGNRDEHQIQYLFNWMKNKLQPESLSTIGKSSFQDSIQGLSVC